MSLETTLANAAARDAERRWREHKGHCPRCTREARGRNWDGLCGSGYSLWTAHRASQEELAENRRLDKLPSPDQEELFPPRKSSDLNVWLNQL